MYVSVTLGGDLWRSALPFLYSACGKHDDRQIAADFSKVMFRDFLRFHTVPGKKITLQDVFGDDNLMNAVYYTVSGQYVHG